MEHNVSISTLRLTVSAAEFLAWQSLIACPRCRKGRAVSPKLLSNRGGGLNRAYRHPAEVPGPALPLAQMMTDRKRPVARWRAEPATNVSSFRTGNNTLCAQRQWFLSRSGEQRLTVTLLAARQLTPPEAQDPSVLASRRSCLRGGFCKFFVFGAPGACPCNGRNSSTKRSGVDSLLP